MGFHVVGPQWRSCYHDSVISFGIGCTLYKKGKFKKSDSHKVFFSSVYNMNTDNYILAFVSLAHVLIEQNETCKDRDLLSVQSPNNCKEISRLMWPRSEIKFNETNNAEFPTACYLYNAELNPEVKSVFYNQAFGHNNGQAVSAPICRWDRYRP